MGKNIIHSVFNWIDEHNSLVRFLSGVWLSILVFTNMGVIYKFVFLIPTISLYAFCFYSQGFDDGMKIFSGKILSEVLKGGEKSHGKK